MSEDKKGLSHKLLRIKEIVTLKAVLLKVKLDALLAHPSISKFGLADKISWFFKSPKLKVRIWKLVAFIAFIYVIIGLLDVREYYTEKGKTSIEDGQRIIIGLPEGELDIRKKSIARKTPPKEDTTPEEITAAPTEPAAERNDSFIGPPPPSKTNERASQIASAIKNGSSSASYDIKDIRPRVVIIISGMGLSRTTTENVMTLPAQVALSFSPYANKVDEWTTKAAELGYELLMDIPLEPSGYPKSDPGPLGLLTEADETKNIAQMDAVLNLSKEHFIGFVAPVDEQFTFVEDKIIPILQELKNRGLTFIYTNKPRNYFLPQTAAKLGLGLIAEDILLDENLSDEGIEESIHNAELMASEKGFVVIVARPYPITVKHLHNWLRSFEEKGLLLIPLSDILR